MKYKIVIEKGSDGYFVAECLSLPGCVSQGKTLKSSLHNISDAIEGYLESLRKHNEKIAEAAV
ncbi:type II toxin-antitoxin system HicB family antitoxin [Candidatus Woesearchaeota archaeon]|nr:type II toxin-antitoxin system HicB family antitoxin [Candidatus Woesearchaeota archaeon]